MNTKFCHTLWVYIHNTGVLCFVLISSEVGVESEGAEAV
jgi:hypothetical protein